SACEMDRLCNGRVGFLHRSRCGSHCVPGTRPVDGTVSSCRERQWWRQLRRGTARAARLFSSPRAGSARRGQMSDCSQMRSASKNIVFVINSLTAGGAERALVVVLTYLEDRLRGYAVHLVPLDAEAALHAVPPWVRKHVL